MCKVSWSNFGFAIGAGSNLDNDPRSRNFDKRLASYEHWQVSADKPHLSKKGTGMEQVPEKVGLITEAMQRAPVKEKVEADLTPNFNDSLTNTERDGDAKDRSSIKQTATTPPPPQVAANVTNPPQVATVFKQVAANVTNPPPQVAANVTNEQQPWSVATSTDTLIKEHYHCWLCKDVGWLYATNDKGEVLFTGKSVKVVRCLCARQQDAAASASRLRAVDGLRAGERLLRFKDLARTRNQSLITHVEESVQRGYGMVTLMGKPGTGKTSLLICAVNHAREAGVGAIYMTVTDLLIYLRQAFDPKRDSHDSGFDERWDMLIEAKILALDELDEFNTTPWAIERFLRLIDERWRRMEHCLTLCATNQPLNTLPAKVTSRLRDGRAQIFELEGVDMRLYQRWE
jgi:DNA replication protein DnaC